MSTITRTCARCGKEFLIPEPELWAYKRIIRKPGDSRGRVHWYHAWSCLAADQRESDAYYNPIRDERLEKARERQKASAKARRERRKRDSARCKADTSCTVPNNKRKD